MRNKQMNDRDPEADPFGERNDRAFEMWRDLLGARVRFTGNSSALMRLADRAYAALPEHRFGRNPPKLHITLNQMAKPAAGSPPPLTLLHGGGLIAGVTASSNLVAISPATKSALVAAPASHLHYPYHLRYELVEFAVFTLAARVQNLVPLHAACVAVDKRGALLMGASGAGKSTLALLCLLSGFEFLSEDSTFVDANLMRATGIANFLHVREDSLRWLKPRDANHIRKSPVIQRRSGVKKFEFDLRQPRFALAPQPVRIAATVFLTARRGRAARLLVPLSRREAARRLQQAQAYGSTQPSWRLFKRNILARDCVELRRGAHPLDAVAALREWLKKH